MPTPLRERDEQLLRELYGKSSASIGLRGGIRALYEGRTADAVCCILSEFDGMIAGFLPCKRIVWLRVGWNDSVSPAHFASTN